MANQQVPASIVPLSPRNAGHSQHAIQTAHSRGRPPPPGRFRERDKKKKKLKLKAKKQQQK